MSEALKSLEELLSALPPAAQAEVRDFAEFLLEKRKNGQGANCAKTGLAR
jgi:hypothetical protein